MLPPVQSFTQMHQILQILLLKYMTHSYCVTIVSDHADLQIDKDIDNQIIQITTENAHDFTTKLLNASEMGCSDYIVQTFNPALFMEALEEIIHAGNARRSDRKLILLPPSNDKEHTDSLLNVLKMSKTRYVANILLIVPIEEANECESYNLITHKFVGVDNHDAPVILDTWNGCTGRFDKNANLFPHDMTNLQGKNIIVAAFTYKPYILLDLDKRKTPLGYDGTEIRIMLEFCRWLNFTFELVGDDGGQWGEIYENRTGIGILGKIVEDKAEIGIASLAAWYNEYVFLDQSVPQLRIGVTCLVPAPRLLASWILPVLPFSPLMWGAVAVTFILAAIALIMAKRSTEGVFFNTFAMLVGQTQEDDESNPVKRYIVCWLLVTGLILDSAYGGGLASVLTIPVYEKPIDTIQELVDSNMEWGATHEAWVFSLLLATEPNIVHLVKTFRVYNADELEKKALTRDYVFSIERMPGGHFSIGEYVTEENVQYLKLMQEDMYFTYCVAMFRKSSPFTEKYNQLISRLHSTGILFYWESQVTLQHLSYVIQQRVRLSQTLHRELELRALDLQNVSGIFIILGIGHIISMTVFILELIYAKSKGFGSQFNVA